MLQLAIEEEYSSEKEPKVEFPAEDPPPYEIKDEHAGYNAANNWYSSAQGNSTVTEVSADTRWNTSANNNSLTADFSTPTIRPVLQRQITKEDFDVDVLSMQTELDSIKDVIAGQMTLDMETVHSLFDSSVETLPATITSYDSSEFYPSVTYGEADLTGEGATPGQTVPFKQGQFDLDLNTPLIQDGLQDP